MDDSGTSIEKTGFIEAAHSVVRDVDAFFAADDG